MPPLWNRDAGLGRLLRAERLEPRRAPAGLAGAPQTFAAFQDASLDGQEAIDAETLGVGDSSAGQQAHLSFAIAGFSGQALHTATLRLRAARDAAFADLAVYRGSAAPWNERGLTPASAPDPLEALATHRGSLQAGQWIALDVTTAIAGDGRLNLIVAAASPSAAAAFWSRETDDPPQLVVVSQAAAIPGDYSGDLRIDGRDLLAWQAAFGSPRVQADANRDGVVDQADLAPWQARFARPQAAAAEGSPADYGARPDDASDDHAAIQAALDAHASVFLPAGEYWLRERIVVPPGRRLHGPAAGPPAVLRIRHDSGAVSGNVAVEVAGDAATIARLTIDKDFIDGSYGVGILAERAEFLTVRQVEIRNYSARYGIHLIESDRFEIRGVHVHDFLMNRSGPGGVGPDMIRDSPAGIRVTRSTGGVIAESRVHDIEVGPAGRASLSELVPSYGPQGYQADAITLSDSSDIVVEDNDLWNSGELLDILVSDRVVARRNVLQMAYLFGVKTIGSQDSVVADNYVADAAIGLWMGDHSSGEQATGNLVQGNDFVNSGSPGLWNVPARNRLSLTICGVYLDDNAVGNAVVDNRVYNLHSYVQTYWRAGAGANRVVGNAALAQEFGPQDDQQVVLLGAWRAGREHARELVARNRLLVLYVHGWDASDPIAVTGASYGGMPLTKIHERRVASGTGQTYVAAWFLRQNDIHRAAHGRFDVTWNAPPDSSNFSSAFFANVYQPQPVAAPQTPAAPGGAAPYPAAPPGGADVSTFSRDAPPGGLALAAAVAERGGELQLLGGFSPALAPGLPVGSAVVGSKAATGGPEFVAARPPAGAAAVASLAILRGNARPSAAAATVDVTTLGALPGDGLSDATIVQAALRNPAFGELYFPPGVYHFDRPVFLESGKTLRGDEAGGSSIELLADTAAFRAEPGTTAAAVRNFSIARPATRDSDQEIVRIDASHDIVIDRLRIVGAASRAPLIHFQGGGSRNRVSRNEIVDYQVVRDEPSPEQPGAHRQIFGSGITLVDNAAVEVVDNRVVQEVRLSVGRPAIKGLYQASAIQIVDSTAGLVAGNEIRLTGQGIDATGSSYLTIRGNRIEECHAVGIKLVNGAHHIVVEKNALERCGLAGVWLASGVPGRGGSFRNAVRNNAIIGAGQGIGIHFWDLNFALSTPAAIHLQAAQQASDRVRDNVIADNLSYDNAEQRGVVVSEPANAGSPFAAIDNLVVGNAARPGPPPPKPPLA